MIERKRSTQSVSDSINYVRLASGDWRGITEHMILTEEEPQTDGSTRFKKVAQVLVTPELADAWIANCKYDKQRRVRKWNVKRLVTAMLDGTFKTGTVEFSSLNGENQLNDANHRLTAMVESNTEHYMTTTWYECHSTKERVLLYGRTDRGKNRTIADIGAEFMAGTELSTTEFNAASGAVKILFEGFRVRRSSANHPLTPDNILELLESWEDEIVTYFETIRGCQRPLTHPLRCAASVAVGLVTLRHCRNKALTFWQSVKNDDGLKRNSGEAVLVDVLTTALPGGRGESFVLTRMIASCWNAAYERRKPQHVVPKAMWNQFFTPPAEGTPKENIAIFGTPYNADSVVRSYPPGFKDNTEVTKS